MLESNESHNKDVVARREVFDPAWLRRSYRRCLWDGGQVRRGIEFCSDACEEAYEEWAVAIVLFDEEREMIEEGTAQLRTPATIAGDEATGPSARAPGGLWREPDHLDRGDI